MDAKKLLWFVVLVVAGFVLAALALVGFKLGWFENLQLPGSKKPVVRRVKLDPRATAECRAYLVKLNAGIRKYAKANRGDPYPWEHYGDMIDNAPPTLVPKYLIVVRACSGGGAYNWERRLGKVLCSIGAHNP